MRDGERQSDGGESPELGAGSAARLPAAPLPLTAAEDDSAILSALRPRPAATFHVTRAVFLRALGFIYAVAFAVLYNQCLALFGRAGLLPADIYVARLRSAWSFWQHPTLFWWGVTDHVLSGCSAAGLLLSLLVVCGVDHVSILFALWALYLSFVHIGQIFYGYGWETLLLETGALALFLAPVRQLRSARDPRPVPGVMFWLLCWLLFRLMFGAGLIKLRGDSCWRDLTCLYYHYETQPNPHPLSRVLHWAPRWFHQFGVLFNHFVEVIVPFGLFVPRLRHAAVGFTIAFQALLIFSGNLSFLNWLTIVVALSCVDDRVWHKLLPGRLGVRVEQPASRSRVIAVGLYCAIVALLSISPALNLLSSRQQMNTSFEPLHLVNSYGAFGSIGRERDVVILEGTTDPQLSAATRWREYELPCQPGDLRRRPCWITPYHYRLDWQMWFAALSEAGQEPWFVHLVYKLLRNERQVLSLFASQPFGREAPRFVRAERYRYRFTPLGSDAYWQRERVGSYLPPLSVDDLRLYGFLSDYGLLRGERPDVSP